MRILSIDDSKSVQAFLQNCLSDLKPNWILAENGKVGLEIVQKGQDFDLIILDWEMPLMTGPEFYVEYKKTGQKKPVIMLTSKNAPQDLEKMLNEGVSDYVMKPFTKDVILEKVKMVLGK